MQYFLLHEPHEMVLVSIHGKWCDNWELDRVWNIFAHPPLCLFELSWNRFSLFYNQCETQTQLILPHFFFREHMAKRECNSWLNEGLQARTIESPDITGIPNKRQTQPLLLAQYVGAFPWRAAFVPISCSIQRHVLKCFTPHIALCICQAHFDTDVSDVTLLKVSSTTEKLILVDPKNSQCEQVRADLN